MATSSIFTSTKTSININNHLKSININKLMLDIFVYRFMMVICWISTSLPSPSPPGSILRTTQGRKGRRERGQRSRCSWIPSGKNSFCRRSKMKRPLAPRKTYAGTCCTLSRQRICVFIYMYVYAWVYMYVYVCICMYMYMYVYVCILLMLHYICMMHKWKIWSGSYEKIQNSICDMI